MKTGRHVNDTFPEEKGSKVWPLFASIAVALAWCFFNAPSFVKSIAPAVRLIHSDNAPEAYGEITGHLLVTSLFMAFVIWAVMYFALIRRSAPQRGSAYFLILWGVIVAADIGLVVLVDRAALRADAVRAQNATALSEMRATVRQAAETTGPVVIDTTPKAQGEAGLVEGLTKRFVAVLVADRVAYRTDLKSLGYPTFLAPENLSATGGLRVAGARLKEMRADIARYKALSRSRVADLRTEIAHSSLSEQDKKSMLAGFDHSYADSSAKRDRIWDMEDAIAAEFQQLVGSLGHAKGAWFAAGRMMRFTSQADLSAYRAHMNKITTLGNQEKLLVAAGKNSTEASFTSAQQELTTPAK
jgi:hypothetical protein